MQRATPYNDDAQIFEDQIVIRDNTYASATGGALIVGGGLSTKDTYITGHAAVNNVKITPNLNDIIYEQQAVLNNNQNEPVDIDNFYFDNSVTSSFKAYVNVNVSSAQSKYALWEINGVYRPDGWVITSSFTGDITGVYFTIRNVSAYGLGKIQYTNNNVSGTTTIRFRANTTAQPGTTPFMEANLVNNTEGIYLTNRLMYANSPNTIATTDITYNSNVLTIGGSSRVLVQTANTFTNFSNGGGITSMGDGSFANNLYVGNRMGISNTSPQYTLDIGGNVNFTGNIYQNGNLYNGSSQWQNNGQSIYFSAGNIGIGTTQPIYNLDVIGNARVSELTTGFLLATNGVTTSSLLATSSISSGIIHTTNLSTNNAVCANVTAGNLTVINGLFSTVNTSLLSATTITCANASLSGNLTIGGSLVTVNVTTTNFLYTNLTAGFALVTDSFAANGNSNTMGSIVTTGGNVGIGTVSPVTKLSVDGNTNISGNLTAGNLYFTSWSTGISNYFAGQFSASNNVTTACAITGFQFNSSEIRSFTSQVTISVLRSTGGNYYETVTLEGHQSDVDWTLLTSNIGDVSGINFTINAQGQILYTSTNTSNWTSTKIKYWAHSIDV